MGLPLEEFLVMVDDIGVDVTESAKAIRPMTHKNRSLVFLVHGLMGHPQEFGPLTQQLHTLGYDTHHVCLPQHGDFPGNLGLTCWEEMFDTCQKDLEQYRNHYENIHLLGFSLGGALSVVLTRNNPDVFQSTTLVATPYKTLLDFETGQYHVKHFFKRILPGSQYWYQCNTGFPKPYLLPYHYFSFYEQMESLFVEVQSSAPKIETPTLLLHSPYDLTVPYEHSEWLHHHIPAETNFVTLLHCGHQVFPFNVNGVVEHAILSHLKTNEHMHQKVF